MTVTTRDGDGGSDEWGMTVTTHDGDGGSDEWGMPVEETNDKLEPWHGAYINAWILTPCLVELHNLYIYIFGIVPLCE